MLNFAFCSHITHELQLQVFFIITQGNMWYTIIKETLDHMLDGSHVTEWKYNDIPEFHRFAKDIIGEFPTFDIFRSFCGYIKKST